MSGNHTPTPWRVDGYHSVIGPDGKEIHANGFSSIMSYGPAMLDARANAELIVNAVNSYASSQAEIERLRTLEADLWHLSLVIESAVREADFPNHADVLALIKSIKRPAAALSGSKE